MTRTKLILAGLIAGALTFGTACKSDKAAEREPADQTMQPETTAPNQGGTTPGSTTPTPGGTGGAGDLGGTGSYPAGDTTQDNGTGGASGGTGTGSMSPDQGGGTTGTETGSKQVPEHDDHHKAKDKSKSKDKGKTGGTGGSGYDEDTSAFDESQDLSGNKFPSDNIVPQP
jgi:hypothetical protein